MTEWAGASEPGQPLNKTPGCRVNVAERREDRYWSIKTEFCNAMVGIMCQHGKTSVSNIL